MRVAEGEIQKAHLTCIEFEDTACIHKELLQSEIYYLVRTSKIEDSITEQVISFWQHKTPAFNKV